MSEVNFLTDNDRRTLHEAECVLLDLSTRLEIAGYTELIFSEPIEEFQDTTKYTVGTIASMARVLYEIEKARRAVK